MTRAGELILVGAALALAGCASGGTAAQSIPLALAAPPPGKGQVVFFRPSALGALVSCTIQENGSMVGRLGDGRYFIHPALPGRHVFTAKTEATTSLSVDIEPGATKYVRCNMRMGLVIGRPHLVASSAEEFASISPDLRAEDAKNVGGETSADREAAPAGEEAQGATAP